MERSTVIMGLLAAGVAIALIASIGGYATLAQNQSNSNREHDEELKNTMTELKNTVSELKGTITELKGTLTELKNTVNELNSTMQGDMMGNGMGDMMNQAPQDVIIKMKVPGQKVQVGKEAQIVLLVLDKQTQKPLLGMEVVIGIERGSAMSTMDMLGDMFDAEDKGSGEYLVRFTPDSEGIYTIHTHVMIPGKSMIDNHMDFGIVAEKKNST